MISDTLRVCWDNINKLVYSPEEDVWVNKKGVTEFLWVCNPDESKFIKVGSRYVPRTGKINASIITPKAKMTNIELIKEHKRRQKAKIIEFPKWYKPSGKEFKWLEKAKGGNLADSGYIYIVRETFLGMYKIGISKNVVRRLIDLQSSIPQDLETICYFHVLGVYLLEKVLHCSLDRKRVRGEWFELTDEEVNNAVAFIEGHEFL